MPHTRAPDPVLLIRVLFTVVIGFSWELAGSIGSLSFFISTPTKIFKELIHLLFHGNMYFHFFITASEAFIGLTLGLFVGACVGLLLWYSSILARALHPFILIAGSIPLVALAPLFIVWFGIGFQMKVALSFFSTVFMTLSQSYRGASKVDAELLDVLTAMQAMSHEKFIKVIIPGSLDWVLGSMRLNIGLGLLGAFLGEFIASDAGLGHIILRASSLYNTAQALAAGLGIALLALAFDFLGGIIEERKIQIIQLVSVPPSLWLGKTTLESKRWKNY